MKRLAVPRLFYGLFAVILLTIVSVVFYVRFHQASLNNRLLEAAGRGNYADTKGLLDNGADVNATDRSRETALIKATRYNNINMVSYLINKGADVNVCNTDGQTPLMNAAEDGNTQIASVLLEHGARVNAADYNGSTALMDAFGSNEGTKNVDVMALLVRRGAEASPEVIAAIKKAHQKRQ